jgi:hypothetical protein
MYLFYCLMENPCLRTLCYINDIKMLPLLIIAPCFIRSFLFFLLGHRSAFGCFDAITVTASLTHSLLL